MTLTKSYKKRKDEIAKLRRESENMLKETLSAKRRSSSRLSAIERKREDLTRKKDRVLQLLNQYLSQRESIERLRALAEERLKNEQDARDQASQQSEYGSQNDAGSSVENLKYFDQKISELGAEIKERETTQSRLVKTIETCERDKAQIEKQLKAQVQAKPALVDQLRTSTKQENALRPKVESLQQRETSAVRVLELAQKKLAQLVSQRKKKKKTNQKTKTRTRKIKKKRTKTKRKLTKKKVRSKAKKKVKVSKRRSKQKSSSSKRKK